MYGVQAQSLSNCPAGRADAQREVVAPFGQEAAFGKEVAQFLRVRRGDLPVYPYRQERHLWRRGVFADDDTLLKDLNQAGVLHEITLLGTLV